MTIGHEQLVPYPKVIHLIPYDGIGGVEVAARSMATLTEPDLDFQIQYLFPRAGGPQGLHATFNPIYFIKAAISLWRKPPALLIVSLWRSALVGAVARLLCRRIRLVVFLHNSADAHIADRLCTRFAMRLADAVWADSDATAEGRVSIPLLHPPVVISYLVNRLPPLPDAGAGPVFAFWGRLTAQKNLGRALNLFSSVHAVLPGAHFIIIGPDGGELGNLRAKVRSLGLVGAVEFTGPLPIRDIPAKVAGARFFLQTSRYEGMCLSVTEAMQLGLVPVVTPVGEVGRYCKNGVNSIVIRDDAAAVVDDIARLIADADAYKSLRKAAIGTWSGKPAYRDSVLAASRAILERSALM